MMSLAVFIVVAASLRRRQAKHAPPDVVWQCNGMSPQAFETPAVFATFGVNTGHLDLR
jgi:hypothetical protein